MKLDRTVVLLAALTVAASAPAAAQVFTPTYLAPRSSSDVGVYLSDGPAEFAIEGIWRQSFGQYDLGFRGGLIDADDALVTLGAEYRNPLATNAPVDLSVTGGVQGIIGDVDAIGVQAGLSIGRTFVPGGFTFTPYLHPRVGLVDELGGPDDDLDLELLADIGLDFGFSPNLSVRVGIGMGDEQAGLGIGLAWR